jgi:hypothetical protein
MEKIKWCLKTKNGLELITPNNNLAEAYLKKAESSLKTMQEVTSRDWKIAASYYSMYFSLCYSDEDRSEM